MTSGRLSSLPFFRTSTTNGEEIKVNQLDVIDIKFERILSKINLIDRESQRAFKMKPQHKIQALGEVLRQLDKLIIETKQIKKDVHSVRSNYKKSDTTIFKESEGKIKDCLSMLNSLKKDAEAIIKQVKRSEKEGSNWLRLGN